MRNQKAALRTNRVNPQIVVFLWGLGGSLAVEVIAIVQIFNRSPLKFPERYHRFWYYVIRILLAFIGGGLAVAYNLAYKVDAPLLAINIGASAPLIIQALQKPPDETAS